MAALLVVVPLLGVVLLNLPLGRLMNRVAVWLAALVALAEAAAAMAFTAASWNKPLVVAGQMLKGPSGIDGLSRVMFLSIGVVVVASALVGIYMQRDEESRFRLGNLLLLATAGMNGLVVAQDLFTLYVFIEIAAVCSYILIAMDRGPNAFEGAFKYLVLSAVATAMMLASVALLLIASGSTTFAAVAASLRGEAEGSTLALVAIALFTGGLFIKGGLIPFHGWLPDAYSSAPAAVSVLLAGIVTKTTGVYTLIRLVAAVFGFQAQLLGVLLLIGAASAVLGAFAALGQRDMKRMLAYSSISQVGYIVLGIGAGTPLGLVGAIFHLFNHSVFKSLLFVNAAALERQAGTTDMDKLGGISSRMPVTGTTSVVAMLSTAGVPPFAGFWSKLILIVALWQAGQTTYAVIAVLASLITLGYFLSLQRRVFFGLLAESCASVKEACAMNLVPAVLLALITLGVGVSVPWLFGTFLLPIGGIL